MLGSLRSPGGRGRITASRVSSFASGMAEGWAVPLDLVEDIGSIAAAARANGVGISVADILLGVLLVLLFTIHKRRKTRTINRGESGKTRGNMGNVKSASIEGAAPSF